MRANFELTGLRNAYVADEALFPGLFMRMFSEETGM
jgi:hypothetical protein